MSNLANRVEKPTEKYSLDCAGPSFLKLPSYLSENGYKNPEDSKNGPFQYGHDTKLSCKDWRAEHPAIQRAFNNHMAGYVGGQPRWVDHDFYPVKERLGKGLKGNSEALIVDVGGSLGHDLVAFKAHHPELPGRLVLQDLPTVINQVDHIQPGIEPTIHDFLTPQPVKGSISELLFSSLLIATRGKSVLFTLRPPRLDRRAMPRDPPPAYSSHGEGILQNPHQ